ncbi:MAG: carbon-nitrogen hydrolase family protein [Pigmentiphaga sp.]
MSTVSKPYKAAVVQAVPEFLDIEKAVAKTILLMEQARAAGAELIAFPETWIPGYPYWIFLGAPAWAIQKGFVTRYYDNAMTLESGQAEAIFSAAARLQLYVVLGVAEREGASLYIAQWLIGPDGRLIARRRKLKATHAERTVFGEGDGSDLGVHKLPIGNLGALCCFEHLQPLSKYAMYAQDEQVHVAAWPSFSMRDPICTTSRGTRSNAVSQVYAIEGSCFVLAPSLVVSEPMIELLCDTPDKHDILQSGGGYAIIYGPDGAPLVERLGEHEEGLLIAEIDLRKIIIPKVWADPAGHYARPDVTRLWIDRRRRRPVEEFVADGEVGDGAAFATERSRSCP